jgi:molybdopterin-containing oxidoreductase family membrane subunit
MSSDRGVLAAFAAPSDAARAIRALRAGGFEDVRAAMPAAYPEVMAALGRPQSPIAFASLPGAAIGVGAGLALTIGTSLVWHLVTGGKPVVSIPPFVVISFELSILVGSIATLAALLAGGWYGGRPRAFPPGARFSGDRVGVFVAGAGVSAAAEILRAAGAEEVVDVS